MPCRDPQFVRLSETIKCFREIINSRLCCGPFHCNGALTIADSSCTVSYKTHIWLLTPSPLRQTLLCPNVFLLRKLYKSKSKARIFSAFTQSAQLSELQSSWRICLHCTFTNFPHSRIEKKKNISSNFLFLFRHFALLLLELRPSNISQVRVHTIIAVLVASDSLIWF